jgi:hypothetical protein
MSPAGFEPTITAKERPQTHTLDLVATGIGEDFLATRNILKYTNEGVQLRTLMKQYNIGEGMYLLVVNKKISRSITC